MRIASPAAASPSDLLVTGITYALNAQALASHQWLSTGPSTRTTQMTRREHEELQRKLSRARRLALEPGDALSRERAAQVIEDLEYQLYAGRLTAQAVEAGY